jgi:UDP-N-acetylmuramoyl-L-alanine---L-glutamate ligase
MSKLLKTLGIIGFGNEGQAIFQFYKNKFDQIYIFDEKLQDLESMIKELGKNFLCQETSTAMFPCDTSSEGGADRITQNRIAKIGDTVVAFTKLKNPIIQLFKTFIIPSEVDFLVKSPGISTHKVQLQNPNLKIQSLISLLFEKLDMSKVIAVTGTKGKSTVSSLIFHILKTTGKKVELLGNIGNININLLDKYDSETYYVFELSSFQCQQLTHSPHIAIWTNFFIDHQDVHKDMEEYSQAKANICRFQTQEDFFITIPELEKVQTPGQKIIVSESNQFQTKLLGQHNQINCQFAFEACRILNIPENQILEAITTFEPIKGRLEKVNEMIKNGKLVEFYTDDLATIPEATWQAILAFEGQVETLITGGYDKGSDYTELANNLVNSSIKNIIYFNPTGQQIIAQLDPKKVNLREAKSMDEAVQFSFELTNQGVCLLSCASASFGMFKNAYDRGEQYRQCIIQAKNKLI